MESITKKDLKKDWNRIIVVPFNMDVLAHMKKEQ